MSFYDKPCPLPFAKAVLTYPSCAAVPTSPCAAVLALPLARDCAPIPPLDFCAYFSLACHCSHIPAESTPSCACFKQHTFLVSVLHTVFPRCPHISCVELCFSIPRTLLLYGLKQQEKAAVNWAEILTCKVFLCRISEPGWGSVSVTCIALLISRSKKL